jgi:hypothetical protein
VAIVTFSQFTSAVAPLTGDYLVGYRFSDPIAQTNPYEFKTTVDGLVKTVQASLTGNSLSLDGSNNLSIPSSIVYAAGVVTTGDITSSANGRFANTQAEQIQLVHGTPNDGINPQFFIGETSGGLLSGFRTIYDETGNRYVLTTQFGTTPSISAVIIDSLGNTTFANSISARNGLSATNIFASSLSATNIFASSLSTTNIYSSSNVGIGTTTPNTTLTTVGNISATGVISISGTIFADASSQTSAAIGSPVQSWQNVTSSRAQGTTYTNSTGRPIQVAIYGTQSSASSVAFFINNVQVSSAVGVTNVASNWLITNHIIPNNSTYRLGTGQQAIVWWELR